MLTVTPKAGNPPRNVISLDTGEAAKVVSSVSVTRDGAELLAQPVAGFRQSAVDDYTAPLGKACTYRAQGSTVKNGLSTIWDETWANLTSWTVSPVGWAVASGKASATYSATSNPLMKRAVANLDKLTVTNPDHVCVELLDASYNVMLRIQSYSATTVVGSSTLATSGTYSVQIKAGKAYVTCGSTSATVTIAGVPAFVQVYPVQEQLDYSQLTGTSGGDWALSTDGSTLAAARWLEGTLNAWTINPITLAVTSTGAKSESSETVNAVGLSGGVLYVRMKPIGGSTYTYRKLDASGNLTTVTSTPVSNWSATDTVTSGTSTYKVGSRVIYKYNAAGSIGEVKTEQVVEGVTASFDESVTVTLRSEDAWIVHPRQPSLSVRMPKKYSTSGFVTVGDRSQESKATTHTVLGSRLPVTTRFGSGRAAPMFGSVTIATGTQEEAASMDALIQDETPLFFNIPAQWKARLATAFYQVTSVQDSAKVEFASDWRLLWTLGLQQVREPKTVVVPTWNWGSVALGYNSWQDVSNAYQTWYDLLIDNRRA